MIRRVRQAAAVLCATALGTLLFSAVVAPMLFDAMPTDRALAGRIAGRAFAGAYAVAAAAAVVAFATVVFTPRVRGRFDLAAVTAMLVASLGQLFWIAPAVSARGRGWPGSFASLHAAAGVIHLLLAVGLLVVAWRLLTAGPAVGQRS